MFTPLNKKTMKRIIVILLILTSTQLQAQENTSYYTAYYTSLTKYNSYTQQWDEIYKNEEASIPVTMKGNLVTFQAKSAVMIKTFTDTYEEKSHTNYRVKRWNGYDLSTNESLTFDIVRFYESGLIMMVVRYTDREPAVNLHYYIK